MTRDERRAVSAAWRVLTASDDESLYIALERLQCLVGWELAFPVWMATHPDPALVKAVLDYRTRYVLRSPMRNVLQIDMEHHVMLGTRIVGEKR